MKLEIRKLNKAFKTNQVLKDIDLELETGHIYGLFGRNGAGKSTLLKCISHQISPDSGDITIGDKKVGEKAFQAMVCHIGEENLFLNGFKAGAILKFIAAENGSSLERMEALSEKFSLPLKRKWEKLSTGERTILKNIIALESTAAFILLDEPILGLDAPHREMLYRLILERAGEDKCFIISTHIIEECADLTDQILVLRGGRIIIDSPTEEETMDVFEIAGEEEKVLLASRNMKIISKEKNALGCFVVAKGKPEEVDGIRYGKADLQKYFISLVKEER